jgi:anti-sigma regulatory factor (Ser/Thr protein kinase)
VTPWHLLSDGDELATRARRMRRTCSGILNGETTCKTGCSKGSGSVASSTSTEGKPLHPPLSYRRWTVISPAELGSLRAQLRHLADVWALPEDCTDRILMIVNELVSNAIDHARTTCDITVQNTRSLVRVLAADESPLPPRKASLDVNAARGRGLQMVEALASRWGWTRRRRGKTVWAAVNCSQP